jgi:hypothetical protein
MFIASVAPHWEAHKAVDRPDEFRFQLFVARFGEVARQSPL